LARRRVPRKPRVPRPPLEPSEGHVAVGRVAAPRGVRGELRVEPLTDFPERFAPGQALWVVGVRREVEQGRQQGKRILLKLSGVDSAEEAEALRGVLLEIPESELAALHEGQYYRFQIMGVAVQDVTGRDLGNVVDIVHTGSNDVYVVHGPQGELLIPAIDDVIKSVDVERRRMVVELMEGLEPR
jgi:16S rRNA processing protein RimM